MLWRKSWNCIFCYLQFQNVYMTFLLQKFSWSPCLLSLVISPRSSREELVDIAILVCKFIKLFHHAHNCSFFLASSVKTRTKSKFCVFTSSAICCLWLTQYWRGATNTAMVVKEGRPSTCVNTLIETNFSCRRTWYWETILSFFSWGSGTLIPFEELLSKEINLPF